MLSREAELKETLSGLHLKTVVKASGNRANSQSRRRRASREAARSTTRRLCSRWCSTRWTRARRTCSRQWPATRRASRAPDLPGLRLAHVRALASRPRQATVYDNQHFGSFVAVVEQFVNCATEHTAGGVRPAALHALTHSLTRAPAAPTGAERLLLAEQRWVGSADARGRVPGSGRQGRRHLPPLPRRRTGHRPPQGAHAGANAGAGHRSLARYAPSIAHHQLMQRPPQPLLDLASTAARRAALPPAGRSARADEPPRGARRGNLLASASKDGTVRLESLLAPRACAHARRAAQVRVWDVVTEECLFVLLAPGVSCCAFQVRAAQSMRRATRQLHGCSRAQQADGMRLFCGNSSGGIQAWSLATQVRKQHRLAAAPSAACA